MAKLGTYEPQVNPDRLNVGPGSFVRPSAYPGNEKLVEGIGAVGQAAEHIAKLREEERVKAENDTITDADLKFAKEAGDLLYDGKTGYLTQQGENALDTQSVHEKIEGLRQKYLGGLATERARTEFDARSRVRSQAFGSMVERHAGQQRSALHTVTAKLAQDTANQQAAADFRSLESVEAAIGLNLIDQRRYWEAEGIPKDKWPALEKQAVAATYASVLEQYAQRQEYDSGLVFLDSVQDEMDPKFAADWREKLEKGAKPARAIRNGNALYDGLEEMFTNKATGRFDANAAREYMRENVDPAQQQEYGAYVLQRIAESDAYQKDLDRDRLSRVMGVIDDGQPFQASEDFLSLDDVGQQAARKYAKTVARENRAMASAERQVQNANNAIALSEFRARGVEAMSGYHDPDQTKVKARLLADYPDVDRVGLGKLLEATTSAYSALDRKQAVSFDRFHKETAALSKTLYPKNLTNDRNRRAEFEGEMYERFEAYRTEHNGELPDAAWVSDLRAQMIVQYHKPLVGDWNPFGATKRGWQLTEQERAQMQVLPLDQQDQKALVQRVFLNKSTDEAPKPVAAPAPNAEDPNLGKIIERNGVKYAATKRNPDGTYRYEKVK